MPTTRVGKVESFLSQPFVVAEVYNGSRGKYVSLLKTTKGFQIIGY